MLQVWGRDHQSPSKDKLFQSSNRNLKRVKYLRTVSFQIMVVVEMYKLTGILPKMFNLIIQADPGSFLGFTECCMMWLLIVVM